MKRVGVFERNDEGSIERVRLFRARKSTPAPACHASDRTASRVCARLAG